jgi:hypothetical protein
MKRLHILLFSLCLCLGVPAAVAQSSNGPAVPTAAPAAFEALPPRVEAAVTLDGVLDEAVWTQASLLDGFSQFLPADGRPAPEATEVRVWYAPTAIYFGIRAHAPEGSVRATLADRDKIDGDDYVLLVLDTFGDNRQAFVFGVNPLGIQADGLLRDNARTSGFFNTDTQGPYLIDLSPDYVFNSKGRLTPTGFEVEVMVPFESLRYQSLPTQSWRFNVIRKVQSSGYEHTWTRTLQDNASFLQQSGTLRDLTGLQRGLVLDLSPEITSSLTGADAADGWQYDGGRPQMGGNIRWGLTNNLTANATINPDFSQVEADVAQIEYDPRIAIFAPEKRPFFLDGIEFFQGGVPLIFTRRIVDPLAAVKLTGRAGEKNNIGLLSAVDAPSTSITGEDHRFFNAFRVRRDFRKQSTLAFTYTDKIDGDHWNRVLVPGFRFVWRETYTVGGLWATSFTHDAGETTVAPLFNFNINKAGRNFGWNYVLRASHEDFRAELGAVNRVGIGQMTFAPRYTVFGKEGAFVESATGSLNLDGTWDYNDFVNGREVGDAKLHINSNFALKGGWQAGASVLIESFKYPTDLYADYQILRAPGDTLAFVGTDRLPNLDYVLSVGTPRFQQFNADLFALYGRDENFFEWASANILFITLNAAWRPTEQLRFELIYNHQQYNRRTDNSIVGLRRVPRLKVEYQLTRALFLRLVGQYDAQFTDALRDDTRTDLPLLIGGEPTVAERTNDFRVDWLFSYRPTPGTVLFLGYGSSLDEAQSFRFNRLTRRNDGFFFKLSYLFRV